MMKPLLAVPAAALALILATPAVADTETKPYTGAFGDALPNGSAQGQTVSLFDNFSCNSQGISSACFFVDSSAVGGDQPAVSVQVKDSSGQPTASRVFFFDKNGVDLGGWQPICTSASVSAQVKLPKTTAWIDVRPGVAGIPKGQTTLACGQPEPATAGTVTVSGCAVVKTLGAAGSCSGVRQPKGHIRAR